MAIAYFASRISDNILRLPPVVRDGVELSGGLLAKDVPIARTGFQPYLIKELDLTPEGAATLGIDISNPLATINVYRDASEVFSPETIASFEAVALTDNHPKDAVGPDNWRKVAQGHVQNIRKGWEALESGEWPLIADIAIATEPLISEVEDNRKRSISCGYKYDLERRGDVIWQVNIRGNHVAVVDVGRAGPEVRINDAAPELPATAAQDQKSEVTGSDPGKTSTKEKSKNMKVNWFDRLLGRGFKAYAADADISDEDLTAAARALASGQGRDSETESEEEKEKKMAMDRKRADDMKAAEDKKRADDMKVAEDRKAAEDKAAADKKAADEKEESERATEQDGEDVHRVAKAVGDHRCKDCMGGDAKCHDCMMHDRLDDILEAKKEAGGDGMEELKEMVGKHGGEEEEGHDDSMGGESEVIEPVGEPEGEHVMANDSVTALLPLIDKSPDKAMIHRALDRAPLDDEFECLKVLRPAMARTKDRKLRQAFDAQVRRFTRTSKPANGDYGLIAGAGRARDSASIAQAAREAGGGNAAPRMDNTKINEIYAKYRNGEITVKR